MSDELLNLLIQAINEENLILLRQLIKTYQLKDIKNNHGTGQQTHFSSDTSCD